MQEEKLIVRASSTLAKEKPVSQPGQEITNLRKGSQTSRKVSHSRGLSGGGGGHHKKKSSICIMQARGMLEDKMRADSKAEEKRRKGS